ncbi:MAG: VOC family protein [Gemmatimonadaceae bacterium]
MSKAQTKNVAALTLAPYIIVKDAVRAIDFYTQILGGDETFRLATPEGKIGHAEVSLGNATLMLADEHADFGALSPPTIGGSPVRLHLTVPDVDAVIARALAAGATLLRPIKDEFYGERTGMILDPFGHLWFIATQIADVSADEMQERFTSVMEQR